jgi:hypothetical protein
LVNAISLGLARSEVIPFKPHNFFLQNSIFRHENDNEVARLPLNEVAMNPKNLLDQNTTVGKADCHHSGSYQP